jgi:hypothetical protein
MKAKKFYYFLLHAFFITGILYAFRQFIRTPRIEILQRRLWAYENWIIMSFYLLFVYLTLTEREGRLKKAKNRLKEFRRILSVNLILLIFPWGIFLLIAPKDLLILLGLNSIYWRILGIMSICGAAIYYFPYRFYRHKLSKLILVFGMYDNFVAGIVVTFLFFTRRVPLIAWASTPLLFYFSYFFREHSKKVRKIKKSGNK